MLDDELRQLIYVHLYITRLARSTAGMQATAKMRGWESSEIMLQSFRARLLEVKALYASQLKEAISITPMGQASMGVKIAKGIPLFRLLYYVDWAKCPTVASLWSFCGYGVVGGKSQYKGRIMFGARTSWSTGAANAVSLMRTSIMKNSLYREVYTKREDYERMVNFLPPKIRRRRAIRYTVKVYLRHLWVTGRTVHGLDVGEQHPATPYPDPAAFGWSVPE